MAVTLYVLDSLKKVRAVITRGISELIHDEAGFLLMAEIPASYKADAGEYVGFECVDGRFRLFEIDNATDDEIRSVTEIRATDAAVAELSASICETDTQDDAQAPALAAAILSGSGWELGTVENGVRAGTVETYYRTRWEALQELEEACGVRVEPYYILQKNAVQRRVVDVTAIRSTYRGRFVQQGLDADNVEIIRSESPRPKVYPLGAVISNEDGVTRRLTIADAEWSKENGDPADKPAGQTWIGVPEAVSKYPGREKRLERDDIDDVSKLMQAAWEEAQRAAQPKTLAQGTISDMEMIAGQTWKAIRKWDAVWVKPRNRQGAMVQVLRIERNYVRPDRTKMTMGDEEPETITRRVAKLTASSTSALRTLSSHGYGIGSNAAALYKQQIEVDEVKTTIKTVSINLDEANARIDLRATKEELSQAEHRISQAEIAIDGANAAIALKASVETVQGIDKRVSAAEVAIDGANAAISLRATKEDLIKAENRISEAEIRIDGAEAEINLKVSKNGVISAINLSSESVTISSSKINLQGYVTASRLEASITDVMNAFADNITTGTLYVSTTAILATATIREKGCKWADQTVVTSITKPTLDGKTIWYVDHNGNNQSLWVATGWARQLSYDTETMEYMTSY